MEVNSAAAAVEDNVEVNAAATAAAAAAAVVDDNMEVNSATAAAAVEDNTEVNAAAGGAAAAVMVDNVSLKRVKSNKRTKWTIGEQIILLEKVLRQGI
jgi:hypothetical protein